MTGFRIFRYAFDGPDRSYLTATNRNLAASPPGDNGFAVLALMRRGYGRSEGINGGDDYGREHDGSLMDISAQASPKPSRISNRRLLMSASCPGGADDQEQNLAKRIGDLPGLPRILGF
jgi:hypothetical protein